MLHKNLFFLSLICWGNSLLGQGLIMDSAAVAIYQQLPTITILNNGEKSTSEQVKAWSLKPYCPTPKHQGKNGSCVGWAVGYGALTIQHAIANNWKTQPYLINQNAFSPMFIYNQIKTGDCQSGAYIHDALTLLKKQGNLLAKDFLAVENCQKLPSAEDLVTANFNKIADFHTLFPSDAFLQTKVNQVKLSLAQNHPVIIGMKLPSNFEKIRKKSKYWKPKIRKRTKFFNHAMVVVGFDDSRGAFEIMNSWGEKWANKGFIWINYRDFAKYCTQAFQIDLPQQSATEKQYTGRFSLRQFEALRANGQALFSNKEVHLKEGIYRLSEHLLANQAFQLMASQLTPNTYLYALGIESDGSIKNYWPSNQQSPKINALANEIFIPSAEEVLQFKKAGKEWIVLLYAPKEIADIAAYKNALAQAKGKDVLEKIQSVFGKNLVAPQSINYHPKEMKFSSSIPEGSMLIILLEVVIE